MSLTADNPPPPVRAAVPGPAPLRSLAGAYGWSRKLRRRIEDSERKHALADGDSDSTEGIQA